MDYLSSSCICCSACFSPSLITFQIPSDSISFLHPDVPPKLYCFTKDTFACIAGGIVGAYNGFHVLPEEWYKVFKEANPLLDFEWAAEEMTKIVKKE